jgi:hypothetical protein
MNINEHRVREFAYQIWESEGKPQGQAGRHWDMACKLADAHANGEDQLQASIPKAKNVASGETVVKKTRSKAKFADASSTIETATIKPTKSKKPKSTEEISA